jgi:hypothetical protein
MPRNLWHYPGRQGLITLLETRFLPTLHSIQTMPPCLRQYPYDVPQEGIFTASCSALFPCIDFILCKYSGPGIKTFTLLLAPVFVKIDLSHDYTTSTF